MRRGEGEGSTLVVRSTMKYMMVTALARANTAHDRSSAHLASHRLCRDSCSGAAPAQRLSCPCPGAAEHPAATIPRPNE